MSSAFEMIVEPRTAKVGNGTVRRVLPFRKRRMVGPFIFADLIGPEDLEPGAGTNIDAHPHIGLSTLTYLFAGRLVHRDSTGAVATIEPGAVNWMTAGGGVPTRSAATPTTSPRFGRSTACRPGSRSPMTTKTVRPSSSTPRPTSSVNSTARPAYGS